MADFVFLTPPLSFPPKPPDRGESSGAKTEVVAQKVSFCDKVIGDASTRIPMKKDWFFEKLFRVEYENGDPLALMIHVKDSVFEELCEPWKDALVIKLLEKNIGYKIMRERVTKMWKPQARFKL